MKLKQKFAAALAVTAFFLSAVSLPAGVVKNLGKSIDKGMDKMQHALGWDTLTLMVIEQDKAGRPTLERDSNSVNRVERVTSYHGNGNRDSQSVTVTDKASDKVLYSSKSDWSTKGDLENLHFQDDSYKGDGKHMKGMIVDKQMQHGRLMSESRKKFSAGTQSWGDDFSQTISYYDDGDMKDRLTERPAFDQKTREEWSEKKGTLGRAVAVSKWNSSTGKWE